MENSATVHDEQFVAQLEDCAKQLVDKLQSESYDEASALINGLVEARNNHIFQSVGQLTRGLHNAIVNFHVDSNIADTSSKNDSEIKDASDRLQYVINMTQAAANKTMDKVEAVAPIAMSLGEESAKLQREWQSLKINELDQKDCSALYARVDSFLENMSGGTMALHNGLQGIIVEQGYQDLTGQVLKKVIGLVTDVESELVQLMRIACQVEEVTGLAGQADKKHEGFVAVNVEAEGPQIHAKKREDVVSNQDEVDDLLSSLGF